MSSTRTPYPLHSTPANTRNFTRTPPIIHYVRFIFRIASKILNPFPLNLYTHLNQPWALN